MYETKKCDKISEIKQIHLLMMIQQQNYSKAAEVAVQWASCVFHQSILKPGLEQSHKYSKVECLWKQELYL
jgi:hypothetical protein